MGRCPDPKKPKETYRQQLESAAVSSLAAEATLEGPAMPSGTAAAVVWMWYCDLALERKTDGFGLVAFSTADILSWAEGYGVDVPRWALRMLKTLDVTQRDASGMDAAELDKYFREVLHG